MKVDLQKYNPAAVDALDVGASQSASTVFLSMLDAASQPAELRLLLAIYLQAFSPQDQTSLVLLLEPAGFSQDEVAAMIAALGYETDCIPELILLDSPLQEEEWPSLLAACQVYLGLGDADAPERSQRLLNAMALDKQIVTGAAMAHKLGLTDEASFIVDEKGTGQLLQALRDLHVSKHRKKSTRDFLMASQTIATSQPVEIPWQERALIGLGLSEEAVPWDSPVFVREVVSFLSSQLSPSENIAVYGQQGSGGPLVEFIQQSAMSSHLVRHFDAAHAQFSEFNRTPWFLSGDDQKSIDFKYLLVSLPSAHYQDAARYLIHKTKYDCHLVFPYLLRQVRPGHGFENIRPTLFFTFPCAGTARFSPVIHALMSYAGRIQKPSPAVYENQRTLDRLHRAEPLEYLTIRQKYFDLLVDQLDYYQYMEIHDAIPFGLFTKASDLQIVVLMRDPRDIVTSYYFRSFNDWNEAQGDRPIMGTLAGKAKEERLLSLLDGSTTLAPNYFLRWPPIDELVQNYVAVLDNPNVFIIRFEDLHQAPLATYRKLIQWLELENPLITISDEIIEKALYLGSFEYQTGHKRARGQESDHVVIQGGAQTACRKGVTGDWKNHFTPAIIKKFKQLTGDGLVQLGYEPHMDW